MTKIEKAFGKFQYDVYLKAGLQEKFMDLKLATMTKKDLIVIFTWYNRMYNETGKRKII